MSRFALRPLALAVALVSLAGCPRHADLVVHPEFVPALALQSVGPVRTEVDALYGRVLLVNFMATWCMPCIQELPALIELQRRYAAQGFTVVMVGMDLEGAMVLDPFAHHYQLPFPLLVADRFIRNGQSAFGQIQVLPESFVIARDGSLSAAIGGIAPKEDLEKLIAHELQNQ